MLESMCRKIKLEITFQINDRSLGIYIEKKSALPSSTVQKYQSQGNY